MRNFIIRRSGNSNDGHRERKHSDKQNKYQTQFNIESQANSCADVLLPPALRSWKAGSLCCNCKPDDAAGFSNCKPDDAAGFSFFTFHKAAESTLNLILLEHLEDWNDPLRSCAARVPLISDSRSFRPMFLSSRVVVSGVSLETTPSFKEVISDDRSILVPALPLSPAGAIFLTPTKTSADRRM